MGGCCAKEKIPVYVSSKHWAHALIQSAAATCEAVRHDDDATLKRLLDAGADSNTHNLDGHSLLGIALREGKPRCRALLEQRGATPDQKWVRGERRPLPRRPGDETEPPAGSKTGRTVEGRGLQDPGGYLWAVVMNVLSNNILAFHLHYLRGSNPSTLTNDEAASQAERSWMFAYAQIEYPRTMSLIVWRRSSMIVMSITTLIHAIFQYWGAYLAHDDWFAKKDYISQSLTMSNVTDKFFWTADPEFAASLLGENATEIAPEIDELRLLPAGDSLVCREFSNCPNTGLVLEGLASGLSSFDSCDASSRLRTRNCTFFEGPRLEGFDQYSLRMLDVGYERMMHSATEKEVIIYYAVATCAIFAWICNLLAMSSWYNLKKSRKWIAIGWLMTFVAPFLISIVPMRMFVSWDEFEPVREAYFTSFQDYYRLKEKEMLIRSVCEPIVNGSYKESVMAGYVTMEEQMTDLVGYYEGTPCLDEDTLTGGVPGLFCDCDAVPDSECWTSTVSCPFFTGADNTGARVPAYPNTKFHPPPVDVRNAGGYFRHMEAQHAAATDKVHMVEFKCANLVNSDLPLSEKRGMCEQPVNPTVDMLQQACIAAAGAAGVALGDPFQTTATVGGCYTEGGAAFFSTSRPSLTTDTAAGVERLGGLFSLAETLTHPKFGIPRPDGVVGAFMQMVDWTTLLEMANAAAPAAVADFTAAPACTDAQCTNTDYDAGDLSGQVPDWMTDTLLVEVCPASCGGCGMMGQMIGTSIKALEMVDRTTGSAMADLQTVNVEASDAALSTANSAFDETASTVDTSFSSIQAGADTVAGGIGSACDTLDDWAPLINTANTVSNTFSDIGSALSSFRRLRVEEAQEPNLLTRAMGFWTGSGGNLPAQIDQMKSDLADALAKMPRRETSRVSHHKARRRLGVQDDCRDNQGRAEDLVGEVADGKEDSLNQIEDSKQDVANGINEAKYQMASGIDQAGNRIRESIREGRNQMIEGFEMTRGVCNSIRRNMGAVRNSTESVFEFMSSGCEMVVATMADPPGNADGAYAAVEDLMKKLQTPIEMGIGLRHALMGFKIMIPAAVAIAPGLMKGALQVKMLVPQSSLPGVFVVLLPWLYCPIMWCLYNFAFQLIGDPYMLAALLLLAYAPMVNVVVGEWKAISQPMNDAEILTVTKIIERYSLMAQLVAVFCIGMFVYKMRDAEELDGVDKKQTARGIVDSMMQFQVVFSMLVSSISKKFYTTLAGVDYMIVTIVEDRRFEVMLKTFRRPPQSKGCCGRKKKESIHGNGSEESSESSESSDDEDVEDKSAREPKPKRGCCGQKDERTKKQKRRDDRKELKEVFANRELRLDDLCKLFYVGDDKTFIKNKDLGMAAARQMRDDAWKAATSRFEKAPAGYITISLLQAQGLLTAEMSSGDHGNGAAETVQLSCNPYVVLEFEQLDPDGYAKTETWTSTAKTKVARGDTAEWADDEGSFKIAVWDLSEPKLYMHVYDSQLGRDGFIGEALYDSAAIVGLMSTAGSTKSKERLELGRCSQSTKMGQERFAHECYGGVLSISARYDFPQLALGVVRVTAVGAMNLKAADHMMGADASSDTSDPFVVITVSQVRDGTEIVQKYQTKKVEKNLNPQWNESFYFDIWSRDAVLFCDVYDSDYASDDYLGQGKLALREYCQRDAQDGGHRSVELNLTPAMPERGLAQKHLDVMDVSGGVKLELAFDEERSRLELADRSKLENELEEAMGRRGLDESRRAEVRKLDDEAKLQFIISASAPVVQRRQPPPLPLTSLSRRSFSAGASPDAALAPATTTAGAGVGATGVGAGVGATGGGEGVRRPPPELPVRPRAPTTSPAPQQSRDPPSLGGLAPRSATPPRPVPARPVPARPVPARPPQQP